MACTPERTRCSGIIGTPHAAHTLSGHHALTGFGLTNKVSEQGRIARAAGIMSAATMISRVLGYVRDMLLAFYLGATGLSDMFFVAFRIPNFMRDLFAEGSMSAALIPVLTEYQGKDPAEARKIVKATFTVILILVGAVCVAGIVFAPAVVAVIAPGFLSNPEKFSTTVTLTRIIMPFLLFISLSALLMGTLNVRRVFFIPALAPAALNITIISTVVILTWQGVNPLIAVAIGVVLGGMVQFAIQYPAFMREGFSLGLSRDFRHPGLVKIATLVLPATVGMAVAQLNTVISNIMASYLPDGSITYLFYSMRLAQFPIGVFGVAMSTAILPSLSAHAANGEFDRLKADFAFALRLLLFICLPAMAGLIALRIPIVNILFEHGKFDHAATIGTANAMLFFSLGIWAYVGVRVVVATFYSMQDTRTPVTVAICALTSNVVLSLALMGPMQANGLALANATASMINFSVLFYLLRRRLGSIGARGTLSSAMKSAFASAVMGIAGWFALRGEIWQGPGHTALKALWLSGTIAGCMAIYVGISKLLGSDELGFLMGAIKKKLSKGMK